jgi:hypothetical protein
MNVKQPFQVAIKLESLIYRGACFMSQTYVEKPDPTVQEADSSQNGQSQSPSWTQMISEDSVTSDQDLAYGQPVIVAVRWLMIISGLILAIWNVNNLQELRLSIIVIFLLAITNFYLQAQLLVKKPVIKPVVYASSAADLILITFLVAMQGGYNSSIYVYYLPAIAAFSVAFPRWLTGLYVLFLMVVYWIIASLSPGSEQMIIVVRLLMIAAVAFCGALFLAIERSRRQEASKDAEGLRLAISD